MLFILITIRRANRRRKYSIRTKHPTSLRQDPSPPGVQYVPFLFTLPSNRKRATLKIKTIRSSQNLTKVKYTQINSIQFNSIQFNSAQIKSSQIKYAQVKSSTLKYGTETIRIR